MASAFVAATSFSIQPCVDFFIHNHTRTRRAFCPLKPNAAATVPFTAASISGIISNDGRIFAAHFGDDAFHPELSRLRFCGKSLLIRRPICMSRLEGDEASSGAEQGNHQLRAGRQKGKFSTPDGKPTSRIMSKEPIHHGRFQQ